jgi:hypothetical protein
MERQLGLSPPTNMLVDPSGTKETKVSKPRLTKDEKNYLESSISKYVSEMTVPHIANAQDACVYVTNGFQVKFGKLRTTALVTIDRMQQFVGRRAKDGKLPHLGHVGQGANSSMGWAVLSVSNQLPAATALSPEQQMRQVYEAGLETKRLEDIAAKTALKGDALRRQQELYAFTQKNAMDVDDTVDKSVVEEQYNAAGVLLVGLYKIGFESGVHELTASLVSARATALRKATAFRWEWAMLVVATAATRNTLEPFAPFVPDTSVFSSSTVPDALQGGTTDGIEDRFPQLTALLKKGRRSAHKSLNAIFGLCKKFVSLRNANKNVSDERTELALSAAMSSEKKPMQVRVIHVVSPVSVAAPPAAASSVAPSASSSSFSSFFSSSSLSLPSAAPPVLVPTSAPDFLLVSSSVASASAPPAELPGHDAALQEIAKHRQAMLKAAQDLVVSVRKLGACTQCITESVCHVFAYEHSKDHFSPGFVPTYIQASGTTGPIVDATGAKAFMQEILCMVVEAMVRSGTSTVLEPVRIQEGNFYKAEGKTKKDGLDGSTKRKAPDSDASEEAQGGAL